jgi:uncharacterized protein (TIGR03067 family)
MYKIALALGVALALTAVASETPQPDPKKDDRGVLTPERLGEMLTDLAYEPKDISLNNKKDSYEIVTEQGNWKLFLSVSISTDRQVLWLDARFAPLANPDAAPAAAWLKLLELSNENDPIHFTIDNSKRVHISMPLDNFGITPVEMRKQIERFDAVMRKTEPYWKAANFNPLPKLEPLTDAGRKTLDKLIGTWVVVEEQRNGKKADAADVKDSNIVYVFAGDKCRIKSKNTNEVEASLWAGGGAEPIPLDLAFMTNRVMQKGIIKLEGDTLTLCIANPDQPRPTMFAAPADFKGMVQVLKRQ